MKVTLPTPDETVQFGRSLGRILRAGDLVLLAGPLGAGKTVLTQGIAAGMGVQGRVSSPTFVVAREHPAGNSSAETSDPKTSGLHTNGIALIHVDAYRLNGDLAQLDDLDLDSDLTESAIVVEWGEGMAERLSEDHLVIRLTRQPDDVRIVELEPHGSWSDRLAELDV